MHDNSAIQLSANVVNRLGNINNRVEKTVASLSGKVESSKIEPSLKMALLAYLQSQSPENFAKLKATCDSLIKLRRMLLTVGRYVESQATLPTLSIISALIAEKGTPEQRAQINFFHLCNKP